MPIDIFGDDGLCVNVYDPEEKDVSKKLIAVHKNKWKAANALGITQSALDKKCNNKCRVFSPKLNKEVSVRIARIKTT